MLEQRYNLGKEFTLFKPSAIEIMYLTSDFPGEFEKVFDEIIVSPMRSLISAML
ncbi:MAG: hypothetical protein ABIQ95_05960 [Bdellovibrionia bacterium]